MPEVQTAYPLRQDALIPGAPGSSRYESDTRVVEEALGIGWPVPIKRGADDMGCLIATAATILGFSMRDQGRSPQDAGKYTKGTPLAFMSRGQIAVATAGAVADGDPVYWTTATGLYTNAAGAGIIGPFALWEFDLTTSGAANSIIVRR